MYGGVEVVHSVKRLFFLYCTENSCSNIVFLNYAKPASCSDHFGFVLSWKHFLTHELVRTNSTTILFDFSDPVNQGGIPRFYTCHVFWFISSFDCLSPAFLKMYFMCHPFSSERTKILTMRSNYCLVYCLALKKTDELAGFHVELFQL